MLVDCLIYELRLMILNDQLDPGSVIVMFEGDRIEFDEYGNIEGIWPDGLADTSIVLVKNLFDMHLAKRRGELS